MAERRLSCWDGSDQPPPRFRTDQESRGESHASLPPCYRSKIGFDRLMLVGFDTEERVTIDTGLWFNDGRTTHQIQDLVIVEVKQARFKARSPIMQALRAQKALQLRVSKYITGAQLLWPEIRLHRYNNRLRMLRRRIAR